jgi:hypothetical protein
MNSSWLAFLAEPSAFLFKVKGDSYFKI